MKYGLDQKIVNNIVGCLNSNPKIEEAVVYGSRAKGNFKAGSDIDMTLKGEDLTLKDMYQLSDQLDELMMPYKFDISIFHKIENQDLVDHINRVGITIYRK